MALTSNSSSTNTPAPSKWIIYSSPCMEQLASKFGKVGTIHRDVFENGCPNIKIDGIDHLTTCPGGAHVLFFHGYRSLHEKKMEEMILFVLADTVNIEKLIVIDPFDPYATMERITQEGVISSANTDAHFWKTLPVLPSGRKVVRYIYDHHTLQNRFFFTNGSTHVTFRSAIPLFLKQLQEVYGFKPDEHHAIAFPDAGACGRFGGQFPGYELIYCGKRRVGNERHITVIDGSCAGRRIVIVDDLCRTGGTLIECAKVLKAAGATEINTYVTHGEFPNNSFQKFYPDRCPVLFSNFWITDSCPDVVAQITGHSPFRVISIVDDIGQQLALH